jgi:hypothetical protein
MIFYVDGKDGIGSGGGITGLGSTDFSLRSGLKDLSFADYFLPIAAASAFGLMLAKIRRF